MTDTFATTDTTVEGIRAQVERAKTDPIALTRSQLMALLAEIDRLRMDVTA